MPDIFARPNMLIFLALTIGQAGLLAEFDCAPRAMAQNNADAQGRTPSGLPSNLSPQQKIIRDKFIYNKLNQVDNLLKNQHSVQARQILEELVLLDPNPYSNNVHFILAESCYQLGNNEEAVKHYQMALKYGSSNSTSIYWNIALAYMNMSDYDQATVWAKKLLSNRPSADLRHRAERFLADIAEQQNLRSMQPGPTAQNGQASGDYLGYLQAHRELNRWPREKLPIKVFIEDDRNVPGFKTEYVSIFLEALEAWAKASQNRLSFQLVNSLEQADLNLIFTANVDDIAQKPGMVPTELGLATTQAYRTDDGAFGSIVKSKIQILTHESQSKKSLSDDEVKRVCLHEIGHALGLSGHSPNDSDIMHFAMSFRQLPALTKQDKQTIAHLYQDYPTSAQLAGAQYRPLPQEQQYKEPSQLEQLDQIEKIQRFNQQYQNQGQPQQ